MQVTIYKFKCSKENKALGQKLEIRVAPTFFLYKNGEKVGSMTGAQEQELRKLIAEHQ